MRRLLRLLWLFRPYWGWLAASVGIAVLALLANVALMAASGWFITAMGLAGVAGASLDYFTPAAVIRACALLRTGGRYADRLISHEATFRMLAGLRVWLFRRLEPQSPAVLQAFHSGDLSSRLRRDVDRLESVHLRLFSPLLVALLGGTVVVWWLGRYAASLALVEAVGLALAGIGAPLLLVRLAVRRGRRQVALSTALSETAVDGIRGLSELLAFGHRRDYLERFSRLSADLVAAQARLGRLNALSQAAVLLGGNLTLWAVLWLAAPLVRDGRLPPADYVMVALAALAGFEAVAPLPAAFQALGLVWEAAGRVFGLADACPPEAARPGLTSVPDRCDLRLTGLGFAYGRETPVLRNVTLDLPQGRRVALTGPIGAGKSTLVFLLTGLLRPDSGAITLNGRPAEEFEAETRRRCFAVAGQNADLFSGTIRQILGLGDAGAGDPALWSVLRVVGLEEEVRAFPHGLDTWLGEGGLTVSGGQARRFSIARALLRPAPVLILDEPGEGLDTRTEQALLDRIIDGLGSRSLLLITHRTAGLARMDQVLSLASSPR